MYFVANLSKMSSALNEPEHSQQETSLLNTVYVEGVLTPLFLRSTFPLELCRTPRQEEGGGSINQYDYGHRKVLEVSLSAFSMEPF